MRHLRPVLLAPALAALAVSLARAAADEAPSARAQGDAPLVRSLPAVVSLGIERIRLPGAEHVGLFGIGYLVELEPGWWLGPSLYGAASGQRGGLFTWGAEAQRRWRLGERWQLAAGLYAGGGGGAAAPVGGGLMLRPHADLLFDFGGWAAGISAAQVRFPSGTISSTQIGLRLESRDGFAFTPPGHGGETLRFDGVGGLGADRMDAVIGRYTYGPQHGSSLGFVGMRLERQLGAPFVADLEADGAASGGADGFAEFSGGVAALWPIGGDAVRLGAHAALGLAGGGAVPTGGGLVGKLGLAGRVSLGPNLSLQLEAGRARAFSGDFSANYWQLMLGVKLDDASSLKTVADMEWALSVQHYLRAQRKDGGKQSLSAVGLVFRRSLGEHVYVSAQAHSAISGGAGAYSIGLFGLGAVAHWGEAGAWSAGVEAMAGAAGGGGVASSGGAVVQPMAWAGLDVSRHSRLRLGAGYLKSVHGELATPVVELSWALAFGVP